LGFVDMPQDLTLLAELARILAGLGLVTVVLAYLKRVAERRRWRGFKSRVRRWLDGLADDESRHPKDLLDDEWKADCEALLDASGFSPLEAAAVLDTAVLAAKKLASDRFFV